MRSVAGGAFMGLANLVPGISGGTMLLAVGVYPQFISGVAEVTTFRFRPQVLLLLGCVGAGAAGAIAGGAGVIGTLLDRYPSAMYSLFIGLALGGVPILWRMLHPVDRTAIGSATIAVAVMALLAAIDPERIGGGAPPVTAHAMLAVAGFAGGAAMILPGVSGAYLLLVLGQYRPIVDAVAAAGASARAGDADAAAATLHVLLPVAVGVGLGVVGVSNLVKLLLARRRRATLGFLLGLLLGSAVGLWPFTRPVAPRLGDVVRGEELTTPEMVSAVAPRDYRRAPAVPSLPQAAGGVALILTGFGASWAISRLGRDGQPAAVTRPGSTPRPI